MENYNEDINLGGVNGIGNEKVDVNSPEFIILRKKIEESSKNQTKKQLIENHVLAIHLRMIAYLDKYSDENIISVGAFLKVLLEDLKIPNKRFAAYIDIQPSNLSALLSGKRKFNSQLALKLGEIFGINPETWMKIQAKNEIAITQNMVKEDDRSYQLGDLLD